MNTLGRGTIALGLADEFPGLSLVHARVGRGDGPTPRPVRQRLLELSDRFRVAHAPALRQSGIPSAYRAFYRQVGVDPDVQRTPLDEAIRERLLQGKFVSWGHIEDAIAIAALETLVPIWAMDAAGLSGGGLGVRGAEAGEALIGPGGATPLREGELIIADAVGPLTRLLEQPPDGRRVTRQTRETVLYCVQVPGVPAVTVEEALTICVQLSHER
jgi:DNA/RNA-binding domain of Phe-tRNA-synthetase-like protein